MLHRVRLERPALPEAVPVAPDASPVPAARSTRRVVTSSNTSFNLDVESSNQLRSELEEFILRPWQCVDVIEPRPDPSIRSEPLGSKWLRPLAVEVSA